MTEATEKVYTAVQKLLGDQSATLAGADYYDLLRELSGHLRSLMDCCEEEHPEDFE